MGKAPADQFYWRDWAMDLEEHPLKIEGAWIRICCKLWWSETRGEMTKSPIQWARILRVSKATTMGILKYLKNEKIGDVTFCNPKVTVVCRRMLRDEKARQANRDKVYRHREKVKRECNQIVTPSRARLSSPSSSSSTSNIKEYTDLFNQFWKEYPLKNGKKAAFKEWKKLESIKILMPKIMSALKSQKEDKALKKGKGEFSPEFQDPERWIKNERWNDEVQATVEGDNRPRCRKCKKLASSLKDGLCKDCE